MKNKEYETCNREIKGNCQSEKADLVKRSASGKTVYQESEYTIIEKDLNEINENKNDNGINEHIEYLRENPSILEKLLNTLGTEIDVYKIFRLTEDQSVFLIF